jgi:3-oxoacid CoA-transferase A subunit
MNKVYPDAAAALADVTDGATILAGGFGLSGNPEHCIAELARRKLARLTIVSNNCGTTDKGLGILLAQGQVKKMISSYVGENKIFEQLFLSGQLEVELCPQGTLAERLRAGGAGIEAFYTPTGFGTKIADGKETREIGGKQCVLERAIRGDFAIVIAGATSCSTRPRATSTRSARRPARSRSPRSRSSSRSASSIRITSTCRRSTCSGSSAARTTRSRSSSARRGNGHDQAHARSDGTPRRRRAA